MEDHSVKNVCTADETSRISALDLYEDLLVRDLSNNDCLSVHEVKLADMVCFQLLSEYFISWV